MGLLGGKVAKWTKVRNENFAYWLGLFGGVVLLAVSWISYYLQLQTGDFPLNLGLADGAYYPWEDLARFNTLIYQFVVYTPPTPQAFAILDAVSYVTSGLIPLWEFEQISGFWLCSYWALEALLILFFAAATGKDVAGRHGFVFCETCNKEAGVLFTSPPLAAMPDLYSDALRQFQEKLEDGKFRRLQALQPAGKITEPGEYFRLVLRGCDICNEFYCVDIIKTEAEWDDEPNLKLKDDDEHRYLEHLLISAKWYDRLRSHFDPAKTAKNRG